MPDGPWGVTTVAQNVDYILIHIDRMDLVPSPAVGSSSLRHLIAEKRTRWGYMLIQRASSRQGTASARDDAYDDALTSGRPTMHDA